MIRKLIKVEFHKYKKTPIYLIICMIPLFMFSLIFIDFHLRKDLIISNSLKFFHISQGWKILFLENFMINGWFIILPSIVIIIVCLSNHIENANNTWKLILSRPIKKTNLFLSKLITNIIFATSIIFFNFVFVFIVGIHYNMLHDINLFMVSIYIFVEILAVIAIISFQELLHLLSKNELAPVVIGITASFGSIFLGQSKILGSIIPYCFILNLSPTCNSNTLIQSSIISFVYIVFSIFLGIIIFNRKDVK
ncbi:MAG: ABC transporter permease [Marinisporobacter sp.]|nr:ABC transporter permease [Marinisporobacter sp.]